MKVKITLEDGREVEAEISQEDIDKISINNGTPKDGLRFWYIDSYFGVATAIWDSADIDTCYYECGNYFLSEQEAIDRVAYMKAENTLRRVIAKANDGWVYDPSNTEGRYVTISLNENLKFSWNSNTVAVPIWYYIKSGKLAEQLIREFDEEFRIYLGVYYEI